MKQIISLVSVPMLAYNHAGYIAQALDGILSQQANFEFEIIVGEDCSTDNTRSIVEKYIEKYPGKIRMLIRKNNIGLIENARKTLSVCRGKYLALCEGDDYWTDPFKLQKQVDFLENNPEYGMVHTDVNHYYEEEKRLEINYNKNHGINFPSGDIFKEYLKGNLFIKTASVVVRKDIFVEASDYNLFSERKWMFTDLPTWLGIAARTKIKYFEESTATYRLIKESASRTQDPIKKHRFHLSGYDICYYFWSKYSNDPEIKKILDKDYCKMMMGDAYKMNNVSLAKKAKAIFREKGIRITFKEWVKYYLVLARHIGLSFQNN
jgi:glycosyltransferase involved in cell wall biosynthesis